MEQSELPTGNRSSIRLRNGHVPSATITQLHAPPADDGHATVVRLADRSNDATAVPGHADSAIHVTIDRRHDARNTLCPADGCRRHYRRSRIHWTILGRHADCSEFVQWTATHPASVLVAASSNDDRSTVSKFRAVIPLTIR